MMSERKNLKTICKKTARTLHINQIKKGLSIDKPFKEIIFFNSSANYASSNKLHCKNSSKEKH